MTITYNENIPTTNNRPSADQPIMQTNAVAIKNILDIDHVTFNTSPSGYHKVIHFVTQGSDPGTVAGIGQTYTKTVSGDEYPFFKTGLGTVYQLAGNASSLATNGYTTLPNGLILQWGRKLSPGQTGTVNFPIAFPTACFSVTITQRRDSSTSTQGMYLNGVPGIASFAYNGSSSSDDALYWMATGN